MSLTYYMIDLCVLCVFVVRSTPSLGGMYLRIHFTRQTWESRRFFIRMLRRGPMKTQGFEARFSQNLAPVSREKPQNPYLAYISPLFSRP